jgi:hypothetical protein
MGRLRAERTALGAGADPFNVGAFVRNPFRHDALRETSPREAYVVERDRETTTQNDINLGIVNTVIGFAPLKPTEFVIVKIMQLAGQVEALQGMDQVPFAANLWP